MYSLLLIVQCFCRVLQVPFVFYQQNIFLKEQGKTSPKQQNISFDKQFQNSPEVIIGVAFYNNLTNFKFQVDIIMYNYVVWDSTISYGSTSASLFFHRKNSNPGNTINGYICLATCYIKNTGNNQVCLDYQVNKYYLSDQKMCLAVQPQGYYCQQVGQFFNQMHLK
ncbi:hypothetical protein ABPG72_016803 [Tetrahymena utriculariae]